MAVLEDAINTPCHVSFVVRGIFNDVMIKNTLCVQLVDICATLNIATKCNLVVKDLEHAKQREHDVSLHRNLMLLQAITNRNVESLEDQEKSVLEDEFENVNK